MKTTPYWMEDTGEPRFGPLQQHLEVDVVVVGGGVTGVTAAYLAKEAGFTVALLERGRWGAAETGHTTAHLTYVTDGRLHEMVGRLGRDHAQAVWDAGLAAMSEIQRIVEAGKIDCEFQSIPAYLHLPAGLKAASDGAEVNGLREDARLASEFGFDAEFLDDVPLVGGPGVRFANQAKFHPRKYLAELIGRISGDGSQVCELTEVTQIEEKEVKAGGYTIRCRHVFIATHVPLQGAAGTVSAALFQTKLAPYSTYAIGAKMPAGAAPDASFWDTGDPYFYLRVDRHEGHDYAILGGADHKTGQGGPTEERYAALEKRLHALVPKAVVKHRWSGQVVETSDGLPFIGATAPQQFVATGFSGNGMTFGTLGAMMACDAFRGRKNPWSALFNPERKVGWGGLWDYLKENADYPYYLAKQLLSGPEEGALGKIRRGEGKVVVLHGRKVAAYRDGKGRLTKRSAICPHLGCVVRWNKAEKTWDCPCHGSRFEARGAVMAGPAETELGEADV